MFPDRNSTANWAFGTNALQKTALGLLWLLTVPILNSTLLVSACRHLPCSRLENEAVFHNLRAKSSS